MRAREDSSDLVDFELMNERVSGRIKFEEVANFQEADLDIVNSCLLVQRRISGHVRLRVLEVSNKELTVALIFFLLDEVLKDLFWIVGELVERCYLVVVYFSQILVNG